MWTTSLPANADVVVLGGGIAGTATARFLAQSGVSVVVVEPTPEATRGVGHVELGAVEQPHRTVAALGMDRARALFAFARRGADQLQADGLLLRCGSPWVALAPGEVEEISQSVAALSSLSIPAASWTQAQAEAELGGTLGPALWLPDDGVIDVAAALHQWRRDSPGVCWVRGTGCFVHDGSGDVVVRVGDQRLTAEIAVIAAGWRSEGLDASLEGRLTPVRDQFLRTAPVSRHLPVGRAGQGWTAWQQQADGCLVVSGCRWASPHLEVGESDPVVVPKIQGRLEAFLRDKLQIDAAVTDRWAHVFASTPDGLPLIGPLPGDSRRIVCAGFGSSAVAWSVAGAMAVAQGIVDGGGQVPDSVASQRLVRWKG